MRDMCSDLDPDLITVGSAPSMKEELQAINDARNEYRSAVRKFMKDYSSSLLSSEKAQWEADMQSVMSLVNQHKFKVMEKVNQVVPAPAQMTEFERATIELQREQIAIQRQEVTSKKEEALAVAKPLQTAVIEKCNELDMEL